MANASLFIFFFAQIQLGLEGSNKQIDRQANAISPIYTLENLK